MIGKQRDVPYVGPIMKIEIWSDVVCPWCYLGTRRLELALEGFEHRDEVEVVHRSYQLDPSAPTDHTVETVGVLASKYGMTRAQAEQAQREMEQRAAADGLDYHLDGQHTGNTFDAHRLLHYAAAEGKQAALVDRLFRAYFSEQRSVFDNAALQQLGEDAGLDAAGVAAVLASDRYADAVAADIEQAREYGITGVPFFVIDGRFGISGAQPAELLAGALDQAWSAGAPA